MIRIKKLASHLKEKGCIIEPQVWHGDRIIAIKSKGENEWRYYCDDTQDAIDRKILVETLHK